MFGKRRFSSVVFVLVAGSLVVGCGSDDSSSPSPVPFDSGSVIVPEAAAPPPSVVVQTQGQGAVYSSEGHPADGGSASDVACTGGSSAAQCMAPLRDTLYAVPAEGWVLSAWTTTGLAPGSDLGGGSTSYYVDSATPSPLIVVFIPQSTGSPPDAGAGPTDAGKKD